MVLIVVTVYDKLANRDKIEKLIKIADSGVRVTID